MYLFNIKVTLEYSPEYTVHLSTNLNELIPVNSHWDTTELWLILVDRYAQEPPSCLEAVSLLRLLHP